MLVHKKTGKCYRNRLAAIKDFGSNTAFTKAIRHNEFIFINQEDVVEE